MATVESRDERALVEHDKRTLERAIRQVRNQTRKSAGDRQILDQLEKAARAPDLDDPRRYHGS